jgi:PH domain
MGVSKLTAFRSPSLLAASSIGFLSVLQDEPHGVIDLAGCLTVKSAEEKCGRQFSFEISVPAETFYLFADDAVSKDEWIGAIGKAIVRYSSSFRPETAGDDDDDDDDDD